MNIFQNLKFSWTNFLNYVMILGICVYTLFQHKKFTREIFPGPCGSWYLCINIYLNMRQITWEKFPPGRGLCGLLVFGGDHQVKNAFLTSTIYKEVLICEQLSLAAANLGVTYQDGCVKLGSF